MNFIEVLFLSIIQGIGEFLPISSSTNLMLFSKLFGFYDFSFLLKISLHVGSLLALVIYCRRVFWTIILGLFTKKVKLSQTAFGTMIYGTIPVITLGILFHDFIKDFNSPKLSWFILIVFGVLLWWIDTVFSQKANQHSFMSTGIRDLFIGCCQAMAIFPGVSRLGICITACRLFHMERSQAISTSLLLAIPSICGSLILELIKMYKTNTLYVLDNNILLSVLMTGTIGLLVLK